jgi:hypothetical protein
VKRRTLRGQVEEGVVKRLIVDDGRLNHGYRVVSFVIAPDVTSAGNDAMATLSLDYDAPFTWNWGDNRQIGWASTTGQGTAAMLSPYSVTDPDHVIIMDLYIQGQVLSSGGSGVINYLIELEPVELTNDEAILTLIKERSQDDLR